MFVTPLNLWIISSEDTKNVLYNATRNFTHVGTAPMGAARVMVDEVLLMVENAVKDALEATT